MYKSNKGKVNERNANKENLDDLDFYADVKKFSDKVRGWPSEETLSELIETLKTKVFETVEQAIEHKINSIYQDAPETKEALNKLNLIFKT